MNGLKVFESTEFGTVRTIVKDKKPWFCLADVCRVLELSNPTRVKERLNEGGLTTTQVSDANGHTQRATFINEPNLYKVIFQSRKPEAERFSDWVTEEVIPSIREHGMYAKDELLDNPDLLLEVVTKLKAEREARVEAERRNAVLMHVTKTYTSTELAKELGMRSAVELNKTLNDLHVQYKLNGTWVLYSDYANLGYTIIKQQVLDSGKVIYHRKWTQDGRNFLLSLLHNQKGA